eukprot:1219028-Pleurochrysis_carterae.AAC.3
MGVPTALACTALSNSTAIGSSALKGGGWLSREISPGTYERGIEVERRPNLWSAPALVVGPGRSLTFCAGSKT